MSNSWRDTMYTKDNKMNYCYYITGNLYLHSFLIKFNNLSMLPSYESIQEPKKAMKIVEETYLKVLNALIDDDTNVCDRLGYTFNIKNGALSPFSIVLEEKKMLPCLLVSEGSNFDTFHHIYTEPHLKTLHNAKDPKFWEFDSFPLNWDNVEEPKESITPINLYNYMVSMPHKLKTDINEDKEVLRLTIQDIFPNFYRTIGEISTMGDHEMHFAFNYVSDQL